MCAFENDRRIVYGGSATFIPRCEQCMRFVKPDNTIEVSEGEGLKDQPNATCRKCGRVKMIFEGFI